MTYGDQLDRVAAALALAQAALRSPTPGTVGDHDAAAVARARTYRALQRQVEVIAGGYSGGLVRELRRATSNTPPSLPTPPPATHPVSVALHDAAESARLAGDMLAANFAPQRRPLTSDGIAILAGVDRDQSLSALAQLARAAYSTDRQLGRWLQQATDTGSQLDVVYGAGVDASDTANAPHPHTLRAAALGGAASVLHALSVPPLADSDTFPPITSPADTVRAVDTARSWLVQRRHSLGGADLRVLTRTGAVLSLEIDHLLRATTQADTVAATAALFTRWSQAAGAARELHSLAPPVPGAGTAALVAAESWLREQLRPNGRWVEPTQITGSAEAARWRTAAADLAARLPDLATLVHRGAHSAVERGELLETSGVEHRVGKLIAVPKWQRADPADGNAADLLRATAQLRKHSVQLTDAAGITPKPGMHEAFARHQLDRGDLHGWAGQIVSDITAVRRSVDTGSGNNAPAAGSGSKPDFGASLDAQELLPPAAEMGEPELD